MNNDKHVVLLVANEYETMELLEHTFARADFCVLEATDLEQVSEVLQNEMPDILVCNKEEVPDVNRQKLSGQLPDNLAIKSLPFIYLQTGTLGQEMGRHLDLDQYVVNPYDPIALATLAVRTISQVEFLAASAQAPDSYSAVLRRKTLEKEVTRELQRIQRYGGKLSLCILEITARPSQKAIQPRSTDPILCDKMAESLFDLVRSVDMMARLSRTRFIWIMPETDSKGANPAIERLGQEFAELPLVKSQIVPHTIQAGTASAPEQSQDYYELIKLAENDLETHRTEQSQEPAAEPATS